MKEIHSHRGLINHLQLLWPHESVTGEEIIQRAITHVLHHHSIQLIAQSVNRHNVLEFHFGDVGRLVYYSPVMEKNIGQGKLLWALLL